MEKRIKVLGTGCTKCKMTQQLIEDVAKQAGIAIAIEKVEDVQKIIGFGVMSTPGVVINDVVVHTGGVPSRDTVIGWLKA